MDAPDDDSELSRRVFIHHLTFFGGGVVLLGGAACKPTPAGSSASAAAASSGPHKTFSAREFAVMTAVADRIIPRDEDPGALDANVPYYIDTMLQTPELHQMREQLVNGMTAIDRRSHRTFQKGFVEASAEQQDQLIASFKNSAAGTGEERFFELMVIFTMEGLLGDPSYGGNKNRVGWALVGFGPAEPPVGYNGNKHLHCAGDDKCQGTP